MSENTILFAHQDQIRALFGARDQHLRHVRNSLGIDVVLKGNELHLLGNDSQVARGREVFDALSRIVVQRGYLQEDEVSRVLGEEVESTTTAAESDAVIDLFERARKIQPRTPGQARYVSAIREHDLVFCTGPAGCGKTYLAVAMAVNALRQERVRKIVLVRPAVEAGEKLGFLPGDLLAKVNPYLRPLLDALGDILTHDQVKRYMENDVIEIVPLAFMRGRTLNETFIILDEGQNTTVTQMKMFLTRMGVDSQIVVTGDITQIDLPGDVTSGLVDASRRLAHIDGVAAVELTKRDIVRHRLVAEIVEAYEPSGSSKRSHAKRRANSVH